MAPWKGFTGGVTNISPAVFTAVYIKTGSEKWQTLGAVSGCVLNVKDFSSPDSMTRNKAINSYDFTAKCNMMQASSTELKLIDEICNGTNSFLFKLIDAVAPAGGATSGWVEVTNSQVGIKAKIVADGDPSKERQIQLDWQGSIYKTDANGIALYTPTLTSATDFAATGDSGTYKAIGTYTAATDGGSPTISHIVPSGLSSVKLYAAGGSNYDTISPINNVKCSFEMLAVQDGLRRHLPNALDVVIEYDCMATLVADLLLLGSMSAADVKAIATAPDGETFTVDNQTGVETNFEVSGDMSKERVARFTHKGKVTQATIDTICS